MSIDYRNINNQQNNFIKRYNSQIKVTPSTIHKQFAAQNFINFRSLKSEYTDLQTTGELLSVINNK